MTEEQKEAIFELLVAFGIRKISQERMNYLYAAIRDVLKLAKAA